MSKQENTEYIKKKWEKEMQINITGELGENMSALMGFNWFEHLAGILLEKHY